MALFEIRFRPSNTCGKIKWRVSGSAGLGTRPQDEGWRLEEENMCPRSVVTIVSEMVYGKRTAPVSAPPPSSCAGNAIYERDKRERHERGRTRGYAGVWKGDMIGTNMDDGAHHCWVRRCRPWSGDRRDDQKYIPPPRANRNWETFENLRGGSER